MASSFQASHAASIVRVTVSPAHHLLRDARAKVNSRRFAGAFEWLSLLQSAVMRYTHTLLTMVGVGWLTLSPSALSHTSSSPRSLAVERGADTCAAELQGQSPSQTPADHAVIDTPCLEFVDVELGQSARIVRPDGQPLVGTWSADFGQMLSDGTYIAPRTISAPGVDRIVLRAASALESDPADLTVWVHLVPSNRPPLPESQAIEFALETPPEPETPGTGSSTSAEAPDVMLDPGPPLDLEAVEIEGETGYIVPAYFRSTLAPMVVAVRLAYAGAGVKRSKCGLLPRPSNLTGACTFEGQRLPHIGLTKRANGPWTRERLSITVDEPTSKRTGLPVGTIPVVYDIRRVTFYRYMDMYICLGGTWRYLRTEICRRPAVEYGGFAPPAAAKYFFPSGPYITLGSEHCETYSMP